jgi:hypothetical protein
MANFWEQLGEKVVSSEWWADNILNYVIFSAVVAVLVSFIGAWIQRRQREKYTGWRLVTVGYDNPPQSLYWEEVERFQNSPFELWKFAKSVLSGPLDTKLLTADDALRSGWLKVDTSQKVISLDFTAIPPEHILRWKAKAPAGALAASLGDGNTTRQLA